MINTGEGPNFLAHLPCFTLVATDHQKLPFGKRKYRGYKKAIPQNS